MMIGAIMVARFRDRFKATGGRHSSRPLPSGTGCTRRKVSGTLGSGQLFDASLDAHLPFEKRPEEDERSMGIRAQFVSLAARGVREKLETLRVRSLEKDDARRRAAVRRRCGQDHCVRFRLAGRRGFIEPPFELPQRVGLSIEFAQSMEAVLLPEGGQVVARIRIRHAQVRR